MKHRLLRIERWLGRKKGDTIVTITRSYGPAAPTPSLPPLSPEAENALFAEAERQHPKCGLFVLSYDPDGTPRVRAVYRGES